MTLSSNPNSSSNNQQKPDNGEAQSSNRYFHLPFLGKLLLFFVTLLTIAFIVLYMMMGTSAGTRFIIEKIISETGVDIVYTQGNLRDGLLVEDVALSASKDIDVHIVDAYVKIGWRALLFKEVHLNDANIGRIEIINRQPPSNKPFEYKTLQLPINLRFDRANINEIHYEQVGQAPIIVTDINADDLSWIGTKVSVDDATLQYADIFSIDTLAGFVDLEDDYPLDIDAVVAVKTLQKVYIDPFEIAAQGSLKHTVGSLKSKYNHQDVYGEFEVQGLDKDAPFKAKLTWDELQPPYAKTQNIKLQQGVATASGVISDIELRVSTELTADDLPNGRYQGRATIANNQMVIERMNALTANGSLAAHGQIDWQSDLKMQAYVTGNDFDIRALLPDDYRAYAPQKLDGSIEVDYLAKTPNGQQQIIADFQQRDGEHIHVKVNEGIAPKNVRFHAPWVIEAAWENLTRTDIPNIGNVDSPYGKADVQIRDNRIWIDATAKINTLNAAPKGNYDISIAQHNNRINIKNLDFDGDIGKLKAHGEVQMALEDEPLRWQIVASTQGLNLKEYDSELPVDRLSAEIAATGNMQNITHKIDGKTVHSQQHNFNITATKLDAMIEDESNSDHQTVHVSGTSNGMVELTAGNLDKFAAKFNGLLATKRVAEGRLVLDAYGTSKNITVKTLKHTGESGLIQASGNINLNDGIKWNIQGDLQEFQMGSVTPQTNGIVTGQLMTSGHWRPNDTPYGDLAAFDINFDGSLDTPKLPKGQLKIDAGGTAQEIILREFSHNGEAGRINAKGRINVKDGLSWQMNAVMNQFNLGYFLQNAPSAITGRVNSTGTWLEDEQRLNISDMLIRGQLKGEPLTAQGDLHAILHLPNNMPDYFDKLETSDTQGQVSHVKTLIERLSVDNLAFIWGNNRLTANGNMDKLQANVNITSLDQISSKLRGNMVGGITLVQPMNKGLPNIYIDLEASNIDMPSLTLNSAVIKGKVVNLGKGSSKLSFSGTGIKTGSTHFRDIALLFSGTQQDHVLNMSLENSQAQIHTTLSGGLTSTDQLMSWQGVMGNGAVVSEHINLKQRQPAQIIIDIAKDPAQSQVHLAAHCWEDATNEGKLCLRKNLIVSQDKGQLDMAIQQLDTSLFSAFLPSDLAVQAKLNGEVIVGWQQGSQPTIDTAIYSDNGFIGLNQDGETMSRSLPYKRISVIAQSLPNGLKVRTDIDIGRGGKGFADIVINPYAADKTISGDVKFENLNIAIFNPFFAGIRTLEGEVSMAGTLDGTLIKPNFDGDIKLEHGQLALLDVPINLSQINAIANVEAQNADVNGSFMSGDGRGTLTGTLNWQQQLQAKLRIKGENLVVTQPPLLFAEITPDIEIVVRPIEKYVNIVGSVVVPVATIRPPEANADIITRSNDVIVIDRRLIGNINEVLEVTIPWSINADIGIDLGNDVNFRGFGAVLPLAGAINVTQHGRNDMQAIGVIQVSRRSVINAFGQGLELNYGQIRFNGDVVNPKLSIEAVKEIEGQDVGVRVKGNVANPNITVFNNAGLTQQQAMNALVTGRISNAGTTQISEEGFKSQVTNHLAAAGLSLGLSGTHSLTNSIGQAFGLESLTVDASGGDDDTSLNVTGYITPDLYIRYGVGVFNAETELSIRYQLTQRFYIEASSAAEDAIDFIYSWRF